MPETKKQRNFRLSSKTISQLEELHIISGLPKTEIVVQALSLLHWFRKRGSFQVAIRVERWGKCIAPSKKQTQLNKKTAEEGF